jgi:hypothetical protein
MVLRIEAGTNEENLFEGCCQPCSIQKDDWTTVREKRHNVRENENKAGKVIILILLKRKKCTRIRVNN